MRAQALEKLLMQSGLPELGPGPRSGVLGEADLNAALDVSLAGGSIPSQNQRLLRALMLLWHDHLDSAHVIAQEIENVDGSLVHGIVHRREPDYSNAAYWFRRVGRHGAFPDIMNGVEELLASNKDRELAQQLGGDQWKPMAFISLCEQSLRGPGPNDRIQMLREIQAIETRALINWFLRNE
jgi:hypothetical protein